MSHVFRQTTTRKIPANAKRVTKKGEQFAEYRDRSGRKRQAPITTSGRMRVQSDTFYAEYRDANNIVRTVSTGHTKKDAAMAFLARLEKDQTDLSLGRITKSEIRARDMRSVPVTEHVDAYIADLRDREVHPARVQSTDRRLREVMAANRFDVVGDLDAGTVIDWLRSRKLNNSLYNGYVEVLVAFGNWLAGKRMTGKKSSMTGPRVVSVNPFAGMGHRDTESERQRVARALTRDEASRLLEVAKLRPIAEHGRQPLRVEGKKRSNWTLEPLTPHNFTEAVRAGEKRLSEMDHARAHALGQERYLVYMLALTTGLRRGEIAQLTVGQFKLDSESPYIDVAAKQTKSKRSAKLVIPLGLARELAERFDGKPASAKALQVPTLRVLNADLEAAGIDKENEVGVVHFHALRHTLATHLIQRGVSHVVVAKAMRHCDIRLTTQTYCDDTSSTYVPQSSP